MERSDLSEGGTDKSLNTTALGNNTTTPRHELVGDEFCDARAQMWTAYLNGVHTDLVLYCKDRSFNVHNFILASQSEVFAAMLRSGFQEGITSQINMLDDDPDHIELMIQFLYRGKYPAKDTGDWVTNTDIKFACEQHTPQLHAEIYALADKYEIPALTCWSKQAWVYCVTKAITIITPLDDTTNETMRKDGYINMFESVDTIYGKSSKRKGHNLRNIVAFWAYERAGDIEDLGERWAELKKIRDEKLEAWPCFAVDIVKLVAVIAATRLKEKKEENMKRV